MTKEALEAIALSAGTAIERLVPARHRAALRLHLEAASAAYNEQAAEFYARGLADGAANADADAFRAGYLDGVLSVEARADRRDLNQVQDPPELRSVH